MKQWNTKGKYTAVPTAILREPRLTPTEKAVLLYLGTFDKAYPSKPHIMDATGIRSVATITATLKALRSLKVITWKQGAQGRCNVYTLLEQSQWNLESRNSRQGAGAEAAADQTARVERRKQNKATAYRRQ